MANWSLAEIRKATRLHTGRLSETDITTANLDDIINKYYQFIFPAEVKLNAKLTYYDFLTIENEAYYDIPKTVYTNYEPPATVNNLSLLWYQNPEVYFSNNPMQYTFSNPWTGDGVTAAFSTTISQFPIFPGTLTITDNLETFEDTNNTWTTSDVAIVGSLGGNALINYSTGAITVTFAAPPANGQLIYLNYILFKPGRPQSILYYNNQFQLFPVPDQVYRIKMKAYKIVDPLVNATDEPDLNEWGQCIVYGASKIIFTNFGETDAYAETSVLHQEQISNILTRTAQDLLNTRAKPQF